MLKVFKQTKNLKNLNQYSEEKPFYIKRLFWILINKTIFRVLIGLRLKGIRNFILRMFGANLTRNSLVYSSASIFAPWNLQLGKYSVIGPNVNVYNKAKIIIKDNVVISQGVFLCTASHDYNSPLMELKYKRILIQDRVWVAAEAFIGPGVKLSEGSVVAARGAVYKDVDQYCVVRGNPATVIKKRSFKSDN